VNTTVNLNLKKPEGTDVVNIADINSNMDVLDQAVANKVDKVLGKQLSTEDYTTAEKSKLASIAPNANNYTHPTSHPAPMITEDSTHRFVSDTEKSVWSAKASQESVDGVSTQLSNMTYLQETEPTEVHPQSLWFEVTAEANFEIGGVAVNNATTSSTPPESGYWFEPL